MCGIAGFFGRFDESLLDAMTTALAHRGPDDAGTLVLEGPNGRVGLGHRRLSIIDLTSAGHQPMTVTCPQCGVPKEAPAQERLWLSYNGELYNYRELRAELKAKGHRFHSRSDSEVFLHLFSEEGPELFRRLEGAYAFALYDGRPSVAAAAGIPGEILLARDEFGNKPLYYAELEQGVLFASELKALALCSEMPRDLDPVALQCYLTYVWAPAPLTPFKVVRKLEPGTAMIVAQGRIKRRWEFYDLPVGEAAGGGRLAGGSVDAMTDALVERLQVAVKRQMVADVPVGAFLSGGLDSSAVVAMAARVSSERLSCFTIAFKDDSFRREGLVDDLPYAERAAVELGVDLHTIHVGPEMTEELARMLYHLDEPVGDPAAINALFISRLARDHGIKVLLSGAGGDNLFSGNRRQRALMLEPYWSWLPKTVRRGIRNVARAIPPVTASARRLSKAFAYADLEGDDRLVSYFYWIDPMLVQRLFSSEWRDHLADKPAAAPLIATLSRRPGNAHRLDRMLYLETKHFLTDLNLNYMDKMSMAVGVEVRSPLLDREFVDWAARLPATVKQRGGVGKWIFKKAMEPYLPREVIYRPKTGFGVPLRHWLRVPLRPLVDDLLSRSSLEARGIFDPAAVQRLVDADRAGRMDGTYPIFSLLSIELWCRMFVDGDTPSAIPLVGARGERRARADPVFPNRPH